MKKKILIFKISSEFYAIDINDVSMILKHKKITPIIKSKECVLGVVDVSGDLITVIDLKHLLFNKYIDITRESLHFIRLVEDNISFLIEEVDEIIEIDDNIVQSMSINGKTQKVVNLDDRICSLIEAERFRVCY